jgi:molecular chaperone GrpE
VGYIPKDQMKEGWVIGVIYIKKQLEDFLKKEEVEEILILGEDFNPEFAECLEELPESGKDNKGKVMEIIQNGYRLNGRVIRAAKVKIGG